MKPYQIASIRLPQLLPAISELRRRCQSIALLDAIFVPEDYIREYKFFQKWLDGRDLSIIDNGQGDYCFIIFGPEGVFITGLGHESDMSPFGEYGQMREILSQVPKIFDFACKEPAFSVENSSFCIWRETEDVTWRVGKIPFPFRDSDTEKTGFFFIEPGVILDYIDGSAELLLMLNGNPQDFRQRILDGGELEPDLDVLTQIYTHCPLTQEMVSALNPNLTMQDIMAEVEKIGYPLSQ